MAERRGGYSLDLGRWLVWLGMAGLGLTFWAPWVSAERTRRVEDGADQIAELLQLTAGSMQPLEPMAPFDRTALVARWLRAIAAEGLPWRDLQLIEPPLAGTVLSAHDQHYLFQLARTPSDLRPGTTLVSSIAPLETLAWPRTVAGPAHSVFYYTEMGDAAFTRNLQAGYVGTDADRPLAGAGQRSKDPTSDAPGAYRTAVLKAIVRQDDERWLVRWRPVRRTRTGSH